MACSRTSVDPIEHDAKIEFISRDDPRALELIPADTPTPAFDQELAVSSHGSARRIRKAGGREPGQPVRDGGHDVRRAKKFRVSLHF